VTPDELERLHDQQQHQAAQAAAHLKLPEHADISDLAGLSRQTMGAVIKGFGAVANEAGSWVDSLPLPLQLMTQPKLTVDMTLATLASDTPFGLSLASLCKLARNGFIYLNLRDYDSDLRYGLKGHIAQQAKLEQLLDAGGVYIGSAVRKGIFDAAISKQRERNDPYTSSSGGGGSGGGSNHYEVYREEAAQALKQVGDEYSRLPDDDANVRCAYFRGRRSDPEAVFWHYAYLRSVEGYLPYEINRQITEAFDNAPRSIGEFTEFMRLARIFHLNFTAPITASFGTTYNITPGEYKELIRLRMDPDDPVQRDPEHDEIIDQFLYCLFDRKSSLNAHSIASLKLQLSGDPVKIVFTDAMIDSLIDVLQRNRLKLKSAGEILQQLGSASYVDGKQAELEDLINQYNAIESESIALIAKEKKLAKVFTAGASGVAALPGPLAYFGLGVSLPWLAAAAAFGPLTALLANQFTPAIAESVIEKVKLPRKLDKMLYRVHKIIH
jgi:hypothetical protein